MMMRFTLVILVLFILCATASESSPRKAKGRKTTHKKINIDLPELTTMEAIHAQTVFLIKDLIKSFDKVLEEFLVAKDEFTDGYSAQRQLEGAAYFLDTVAKYVPPSNEKTVSNLKTLRNSISEKAISLDTFILEDSGRKKKNREDKPKDNVDFTAYIPYRVKAIKEILAALKTVNYSEFPFERVRKLSKLLMNFAEYLNYENRDHLDEFRKMLRGLRKREVRLKVTTSSIDFKNIEQVYASYSQELLEIIQKTLPAPKGIHSQRLSDGIYYIASAASQYVGTSPNAKQLKQQIDEITKKERETVHLYSAWKDINGVHEKSESGSNSSDEE